jgi:excisionase family DNA binding protein
MSQKLLTVEQAAEQLNVHPKTVLRYIHEQRLPATRIGKSYRIVRTELDAFAGVASRGSGAGSGTASVATTARATCIVDIPDMTSASAEKIATFLSAAAMARNDSASPVHLETVFDPHAKSLKVVLIASPSDAAKLLEMLHVKLDSLS